MEEPDETLVDILKDGANRRLQKSNLQLINDKNDGFSNILSLERPTTDFKMSMLSHERILRQIIRSVISYVHEDSFSFTGTFLGDDINDTVENPEQSGETPEASCVHDGQGAPYHPEDGNVPNDVSLTPEESAKAVDDAPVICLKRKKLAEKTRVNSKRRTKRTRNQAEAEGKRGRANTVVETEGEGEKESKVEGRGAIGSRWGEKREQPRAGGEKGIGGPGGADKEGEGGKDGGGDGGEGKGGRGGAAAGKKPGMAAGRSALPREGALEDDAKGQRDPPASEPTQELQETVQNMKHKQMKRSDMAKNDRAYTACDRLGNTWMAKISCLLLFCMGLIGQMACVGAGPVPISLHVEGRGRILQGENYSLVCVVTPSQVAHTSFSWYINDTLLDRQTGQELNFTPLSRRHEGDYRCGLKSETVESGPFTLRVFVLENISLVSEVEVEEGQTVILNCSVHSVPPAFLTWRLGGDVQRTKWSNSDSLVLHNAWLYHLRTVECEARNREQPLSPLLSKTLIRQKGTYEIVARPQLGQRGLPVLHSPFGMECLVMELPNQGVNVHLTYTWYKDNVTIEGQSDMILDFPSLRKEDSGNYTCTARNGKPRTTSPQSNAWEMVVLVLGNISLTTDLAVNEGDHVTLTCSVDSNPAAHLSWLVEGREVRHVTANVDHYVLERAACSDNKTYTCRASNPHLPGLERHASTHVTVNCTSNKHGRMAGLDIFVVHGDRKAVKGQSHGLRCLSAAAPHQETERVYFWVKDDRVMENETAEYLVILGVTEEHHGVYQCGREHSNSVLLSEPFELHVLDERTPGLVQIGVPIIVLAVAAVVAAAIAVVLVKKRRKKTHRKRQRNKPILRKRRQ